MIAKLAHAVAIPTGMAKTFQYDAPVHAKYQIPSGVVAKNANTEKIAARTIQGPRPNAAPTMPGAMLAVANANHVAIS